METIDTTPRAARPGGRGPTDQQLYWAAATGALAAAGALAAIGDESFRPFFGPVPAPVGLATVAAAGGVIVRALRRRGWGEPAQPRRPAVRHLGSGLAAAVGLAAVAVAFDTAVPFPEDLNVAWPRSLLFYPAVAFVAEVALHLAPLLGLTIAAERLGHPIDPRRGRRGTAGAIVAVAGIEAAFQAAVSLAGPTPWAAAFVAPHLMAFGVVALLIFRRAGFGAMLGFRLAYYLIWHVGWGAARLELLF